MKTGPQFVIEYMTVYQIIADKQFWSDCPEFQPLQAQGVECHRKVVTDVLSPKGNCTGCGTLSSVVKPFAALFSQHAANLLDADAAQLDSFIAYISKKRGYRPVPILLYNKDSSGETRQLQL